MLSLDQHTPTKNNTSKNRKFHIQKHTNNLDQELQDEIETKIRRTCENYPKLKVPYRHQNIVDKLSRNTDTIILTQVKVKGQGVTILNHKDYIKIVYQY